MSRPLALAVSLFWWSGVAFGAPPLAGELKKFDLLTGSKNQPALAVLASGTLYYAEGKNLESSRIEDCPAVDLYRYDLKEKKEYRIAEVACVWNLLSDGASVYAVLRDDKAGLSVAKVGADQKLVPPADDWLAIAKARVAFKRSALKLPRGVEQTLVGFVLRENELNVVLRAADHFFLDPVSFGANSKQTTLVILAGDSAPGDERIVLGGSLYGFTRGSEGWLRVVENSLEGKSTVLGHQRPLAKNWKEAGPLDWAARNPKFLTALPNGFLVADRTSEAFSEATAVSLYDATDKKFYRLNVPDQDVGGLAYVADGVLISKPMSGAIVWYGTKNPFSGAKENK